MGAGYRDRARVAVTRANLRRPRRNRGHRWRAARRGLCSRRSGTRARSLVVARDGAVVRELSSMVRSGLGRIRLVVTKSMLALTVGIALDRGCLRRSTDDRRTARRTTVADPEKAAVTLRHLLTMSSGLDFRRWPPTAQGRASTRRGRRADQVRGARPPMTAAPGARSSTGRGRFTSRRSRSPGVRDEDR